MVRKLALPSGSVRQRFIPKNFPKRPHSRGFAWRGAAPQRCRPACPKLQSKPTPSALASFEAASSTPKPKSPPGGINQILFTGFAATHRAELEQKALDFGLKVMSTPGKTLTFLCYGDNAGPTKVAKALEAGAFIIDSEQFLSLITTGEMP